jgi:hypothetical protein
MTSYTINKHPFLYCPNPVCPAQEYGRIDVHDPRNSLAASPSSAFSPVQLGLSRLEAVVDVKPACYSRFKALYEARSTQGRCAHSMCCLSHSLCLQSFSLHPERGGPAHSRDVSTPVCHTAPHTLCPAVRYSCLLLIPLHSLLQPLHHTQALGFP